MEPSSGRASKVVLGLIGVQAANAAFDAVALYPVAGTAPWAERAKEWAKIDLDRLGFPQRYRFLFPIIKGSSVAGLLAGLRWRPMGRLTSAAIVAYFVAALGFHARAKDRTANYVPAAGMLFWAYRAFRVLK